MGATDSTSDFDARRALAKRTHDVTGAIRTLRFLCDNLESGYKFDDTAAAGKIAAVRRAVSVLERESAEWLAPPKTTP